MAYGRESASDLFYVAEQLEAIRGLILADTPIKARMALILLDGLADAILFRRIEEIYRASDEPLFRHQMPRYPSKGRQRARQRFNRRVDLVSQVTELDRWLGDGQPLVDEHDAALVKVGHSYRNDAYHEDAHNPTAISSVVRLLFGAVARLVVHTQRRGWGEWGVSESRQQQLSKWGMTDVSELRYTEAAEAMAEHLTAGLEVDPAQLRELLAEDIESRVESVRDDVEFLRSNTSVDPATIILGVELQAKCGADEELPPAERSSTRQAHFLQKTIRTRGLSASRRQSVACGNEWTNSRRLTRRE
jgi:hypothetical protein